MRHTDITIKDIELIVEIDKEVSGEELKYNIIRSSDYHYAEVYERFRLLKDGGEKRKDKFTNIDIKGRSDNIMQSAPDIQNYVAKKKDNKSKQSYKSLSKSSVIKFGKYKGKTVECLMKEEPDYLAWLYYNTENTSFTEDVRATLNFEKIHKPGTDAKKFNKWKLKNK